MTERYMPTVLVCDLISRKRQIAYHVYRSFFLINSEGIQFTIVVNVFIFILIKNHFKKQFKHIVACIQNEQYSIPQGKKRSIYRIP